LIESGQFRPSASYNAPKKNYIHKFTNKIFVEKSEKATATDNGAKKLKCTVMNPTMGAGFTNINRAAQIAHSNKRKE
jgi:hypothetical protein